MLVLSRKSNQTLHIGDDIVVTVLRVRGDMVRIGIQAPADVKIMRNELIAKIASQSMDKASLPNAAPGLQSTHNGVAKLHTEAGELPSSTKASSKLRSNAINVEGTKLSDDDHNLDDGPMCSGPLTKYCKPQLRAVFASAT